ncbi:unnamed protein product [Urochloa decumbens]|uniref:J domain-containing protein n=1 Tax=Urochloa decumbens TaxID=240449 RepID=A0ABC9BXR4_9POAL
MVECNKELAVRAREIAINKMESNDFFTALKIALEAQRLFPELESISRLLTVCNVHCAAEVRVNGEMDWYGIFQVEEAADKSIIRKQYLSLTRSLHTDKNRLPGAEAAFKLVSEAYSILYEPSKRYRYDIKTNRNVFWTKCPFCKTQYQYYFQIWNKSVNCQQCGKMFFASALKEQAIPTSLSVSIPVKPFQTRVKPPAGQVAGVEIQFSTLNQDKSSVPTENDNTHARLMPDPPNPSMVGTHNSGLEDAFTVADAPNVPSSAKHSSAGGETDGQPSIGQSTMYAHLDSVFGAFRAREIAIEKMESNDFVAALKIVLEAQRLFPELESMSHLLTVCNVHCAAEVRVNGEMDWYGIFQVEEAADKSIITKQYLNLTRSLHSDKNRFPGAEAAFRLVSEAYSILHEPMKRYRYDIRTNRNVFWTKCPFCKTQYQYYFRILNKGVNCQQCRRRFFASALKEQAIPTSSSVTIPVKPFRTRNRRRRDTCSQQGHHVKLPAGQVTGVEVQFSTLNQDKSSVHARLMPDPPVPNMVDTNNSGLEDTFTVADAPNVPSSAKHSSAGGKTDGQPSIGQSTMLHEGVGIPMENNNTGERSIPYPADPKVVDPETLDSMEDAEVLSAVETSTRKQHADENTVLNSDSNKRQRKNDSPLAHVDISCKQILDDNATSVSRQPAPPTHASIEANIKEKVKTTGTCDQHTDASPEQDTTLQDNAHGANQLGGDQCIYKYPDTEFHRFEEERSREMFERGQLWALYHDADAFPKLYGCITKVVPEPFVVRLIWLEACPQQEQEKRWLEQEISISCGTFRVSNRGARYDTTSAFSHLVDATETSTLFQLEILPQVGEVWAMYMNWTPDWSPSSINTCEFALGEVVSRSEAGTKLSFLTKVDGYVAVFKPDDGREVLDIPTSENSRFFHRIPCFRLSGEKGGVLHGFYELDPASVPSGFLCCNLRGHPMTCSVS